jgi:hypothetical protein
MRRFGWLGPDVPTLEETGEVLGLTRERIRQLEVKLRRLLERTDHESESFESAANVLRSAEAPTWIGAGEAFLAAGLVDDEMPDEGVAELFTALGQAEVFRAYCDRARGALPMQKALVHAAQSLARSVGVASVEWATTAVGFDDLEHARAMLRREGWCEFLDSDWFWNPSIRPGWNRTENVTRKMLAACGPLEIVAIRGGLDRVHRFRRAKMPHLPPSGPLRLFFSANPRFDLHDELVASTVSLDPVQELDATELALFRILSAAPHGVLDRTELIRQGLAAGINMNSLSVYTSYSPILDNPIQDRWTLRGLRVSPAVLEQAGPQRHTRFHDETWLPSGELQVSHEVGTTWSLVIGVPQAYVRLLGGQTFGAVDAKGAAQGQIRFNASGGSWGYSTYLQAQKAAEGDHLVATFDLVTRRCHLALERQRTRKDAVERG